MIGQRGLGTKTRSLVGSVRHLDVLDDAVCVHSGHNGNGAAESLEGSGYNVSCAVICLIDFGNAVHKVHIQLRKAVCLGQDFRSGFVGHTDTDVVDDRLRDLVGRSQQHGSYEADADQHDSRSQHGFLIHSYFTAFLSTPLMCVLVQRSMCGVRMFISRMAKETPSG